MNSKNKGDISEAMILTRFLELNIPVSIPFSDNESYDLIIDINGILKKVQVKTGRLRNGVIIFNTCNSINTNIIKNRKEESYIGKVDYICMYCPDTKECYMLDVINCGEFKTSLRVNETKNIQSKYIKYAKDYILTNSLIGRAQI